MGTHKMTFSKKRYSKLDHAKALASTARVSKSRPDPREYVAEWLSKKSATYSYGTDSIHRGLPREAFATGILDWSNPLLTPPGSCRYASTSDAAPSGPDPR